MLKPETSGAPRSGHTPATSINGDSMTESFNIFTEVSTRHLLAYMDDLAQADAARDLGEPLSEEVCKDPFTLKIDFLQRELAACKESNEQLLCEQEAHALSADLASAVSKDVRQELDFVRAGSGHALDDLETLGELNRLITWLMGKFHFSRHVSFLRGENVFIRDADPQMLKEDAWFMYLSAINVHSMGEILHACKSGMQTVAAFPAELSPFFDVLEGFDTYFSCVIACIDSLAHVERGSLERLPDLNIPPPNGSGLDGLAHFLHLLAECRQHATRLEAHIRKRCHLFLRLFAIVYSSFPDPDYRKAAEFFKKRGVINEFIQSSRI